MRFSVRVAVLAHPRSHVYASPKCETKPSTPSLCRAFSVAENLESLWAIAGHGLIPMSAQQLIDCALAASGCDGGISNEGFEVWITIRLGLLVRPSFTVTHHNRYYQSIMNAGGLESAASYPYTAKTDRCSFNSSDIAAKIWGYMLVTRFGSEPIMVPIWLSPASLVLPPYRTDCLLIDRLSVLPEPHHGVR